MDLDALVSDAQARIAAADGSAALEEVRIDVLGRKAPLVLALRELGSLDPDERRTRGAGHLPDGDREHPHPHHPGHDRGGEEVDR